MTGGFKARPFSFWPGLLLPCGPAASDEGLNGVVVAGGCRSDIGDDDWFATQLHAGQGGSRSMIKKARHGNGDST